MGFASTEQKIEILVNSLRVHFQVINLFTTSLGVVSSSPKSLLFIYARSEFSQNSVYALELTYEHYSTLLDDVFIKYTSKWSMVSRGPLWVDGSKRKHNPRRDTRGFNYSCLITLQLNSYPLRGGLEFPNQRPPDLDRPVRHSAEAVKVRSNHCVKMDGLCSPGLGRG